MALSFIFDAEKGETPASIARKRALAAMIMGQIGNRPARNEGEGIGNALASIGQGIQTNVLNRRANAAETAGQESANSVWNPLIASLGGAQAFPAAPDMLSGTLSPSSQPTASAAPETDAPSQRVASAFAASDAAPNDTGWLDYANKNAIRNQPLDPKLTSALSFLPDMGVTMKVFSGGQEAEGPRRTGSHRHDHGDAADVFFYKDGRQLDWANPQDRPIFQQIVERAKANGVTGFGAGEGYMRPGSMHIGFGTPAVWGAGGKGANAPDWLRQAFNTPYQAPPAVAATNAMAGNSPAVPPLPAPVNVPDMPVASQPAQQPVQVAQAANTGTPGQMSDADALKLLGASPVTRNTQGGPSVQMLLKAASNPFLNDTQKAVIQQMLKQQLDPNAALDTEYKRAQIDYYKRRGGSLINAGNGNIYDPQTGSWISAPDDGKSDALFDGKSVQAQGLNYLVRTGELTKEQAAQLAAGKTITDPSTGAITFMTPQGLVTQPANAAGGSGAQSGNGAPNGGIALTAPKKPTDTEYVTGTYADRMANSGKIIDELEKAGTSYKEKALSNLPFGAGNYAISDDYQRFDQAERDFINAVLRRESGAVINPDEFENGKKQYFPQPGDSEAVIEQKRRNRQIAIEGMRRAAGPSYAAGQDNQPEAATTAPKVRRYNPQTGELE